MFIYIISEKRIKLEDETAKFIVVNNKFILKLM